jgi:hypothetical protein
MSPMFYVVIQTAAPGGNFTVEREIRFDSEHAAIDACERMQADFDADAEPCRVMVLDAARVPIWAGGARGRPSAPTPRMRRIT